MLYEEYEKKVVKKARVLRVFYHFRIPIIIFSVLAVSSGGTLAGTKGLVKDRVKLTNTYVYGETYEYLSQAFLSDVEYEFSKDRGETWTSEVPVLVGEYEMRAKSKNIVNTYYYGETQKFEIVPKEIDLKIKEESITYGETPSLIIKPLLEYEDKSNDNYQFDYGDITKDTWTIKPIINNLHIFNAEGTDVTYCYNMTPIEKDVVINKRQLIVNTAADSKTYDGTPLSNSGFEIIGGTLAWNDTIECDSYTSVTVPSTVLNDQTYIIKNSNYVNVTNHYDIGVRPSSLVVNKRPISLSSSSYEYTYDAKDHTFDLSTIKLEGTLADGEEITYSYKNDESIINVGTYQNAFTYKITRGEEDVTSYYDVKTTYGNTVIKKRPITLTSSSYEYVYNGKSQIFDTNEILLDGTLAEGEILTLGYASTDGFKKVGTYANAFTYKVTNGENDVTDNYSVACVVGNTVITKRLITLTSANYEYTYDGLNHKFDLNNVILTNDLAENENYVLSHDNEDEVVDVGTYTNSFKYNIYQSEEETTENYDVTTSFGKTTINKRPIKLEIPDREFVYDGLDHKFTKEDIVMTGTLATGEELVVKYDNEAKWIKVGEYNNNFTVDIYRGEKIVNYNYDIEYSYGKTTINKRPITLTTEDIVKTYDNIPVINDEIVVKEGSIATTDKFVVEAPEFIDSGEYINKVEVSILNNESNEDFTDNYDITLIDSTVTINKVKVEIVITPLTVVYDGKTHTNEYVLPEDKLVDKDKYVEIANNEEVDAGVYDNEDLDVTVVKGDKTDNLKNYDITYKGREDAVTINKRPISIDIISKVKLYDAEPILNTLPENSVPYTITSGDLAENEYIYFNYLNNPTDAGEYDIEYEFEIYHKLGEEANTETDKKVTDNYEIAFDEGTFTINKRSLDITTLDYEHVYNRVKTFEKDEEIYKIEEECDGLVKNHEITVFDITCEEVNVGTYSYTINEATFKIQDKEEHDVTKNYKVTFNNDGQVTIFKREVHIDMLGGSHIYDGYFYSTDKYKEDNLIKGDYLKFEGLPSIKHVFDGIKENRPTEITVYMDTDEEVTTNYEIIIDSCEDVKILPRDITIESSSFSKTFDGVPLEKGGELTIKEGSLAYCDTLTALTMDSKDYTYVHNCNVSNNATYVFMNDEFLDVTLDYNCNLICGNIKIDPCHVVVDTYATNLIYDGNTYQFTYHQDLVTESSDDIYIVEGEMPDKYYLELEIQSDVMKKPGYYSYSGFTATFTTDNEYGYAAGDIFVEPLQYTQFIANREVVIGLVSGTKIYDGKGFLEDMNDEDIWWIKYGSLCLGDVIMEVNYEDVVDVGAAQLIQFTVVQVINSDTMEDVTDCYTFNVVGGLVTIYED